MEYSTETFFKMLRFLSSLQIRSVVRPYKNTHTHINKNVGGIMHGCNYTSSFHSRRNHIAIRQWGTESLEGARATADRSQLRFSAMYRLILGSLTQIQKAFRVEEPQVWLDYGKNKVIPWFAFGIKYFPLGYPGHRLKNAVKKYKFLHILFQTVDMSGYTVCPL